MAIARVTSTDSGQRANVAKATTYALTITAPSSGNVLVLCVENDTNATLATPSGWTQAVTYNDTTEVHLYYRVADGTEGTTINLSVSGGATHWCVWYGEYSGVSTSTPLATTTISEVGAGAGHSSCPKDEPTYLASAHLNFMCNVDTGAGVNITADARTDNPKSATKINSTGGGILSIYHTNSLVSDAGRTWMNVWERILTGSDQSVTCVSSELSSSAQKGISIATILNPSSGVAVSPQASGTGTAVFRQAKDGTWISGAASASVSTPAANLVGSLLVIVAGFNTNAATLNSTITTPAGWTRYTGFPLDEFDLAADSVRSVRWYVFWKIATGTGDNSQSLVFGGSVEPGGWAELEFTGPFNGTEQGLDSYAVSITALGSAFDSTVPAYAPSGDLELTNGSLTLAGFEQFSNVGNNGFTNSFVLRSTGTSDTVPHIASRTTAASGHASTRIKAIKDGTSPDRCGAGFIIGFQFPGGADHWAWAEGSDDMDSWGPT
jgi:hypothetical protein